MPSLFSSARLYAAAALLLLGCGQASDDATASAPAEASAPPAEAAPARVVTAADSVDLPATNYYAIATPKGRMVVRLYDETPIHRDNFKKLVKDGTLDGTLFHRIIEGFMIQGGDPWSKDDDPSNDGQGDPGYTLPAEIVQGLWHTRGALSAARQGDAVNPERRSSGSQFYIVQGQPFDGASLDQAQGMIRQQVRDAAFTFPDSIRAVYAEQGGYPPLDGQYTVFGTLVEGFDVLDALAAAPTPRKQGQRVHPAVADRPLEALPMTVTPLPDYAE